MSRPSRDRAIALFALLAAAACQDYNFNPVGHCVIQPGQERVELSKISRADVLFVVDDSGSMEGEQQKLADNFGAFIGELDETNVERATNGQVPIDFHLAVTTTSVFHNAFTDAMCRTDCPNGVGGGAICCAMNGSNPAGPMLGAQRCQGSSDTNCVAGACRNDCRTFAGEYVCCDPGTRIPALNQQIACAAENELCGDLRTHYRFSTGCAPGSAAGQNERPYPAGSFVGLNANPRVIHFDKQMYPVCDPAPCTVTVGPNLQGFTSAQLQSYFRQNVVVGTCGSGQEQALEAARKAVVKAEAGEQQDTVGPSGTPGATVADWLPEDSKLVLVFVGDEDDCSSPADPSGGIVLAGDPGSDSCVADAEKPPEQRKQFSVSDLVEEFEALAGDRPMGAAFIVSARSGGQDVCQDQSCVADICCDTACTGTSACTSDVCGGQAKGSRLLEAAQQLRSKGADVVAGSVCDPNFNDILIRIAEIVKPPSGLLLPTQPAAVDVIVLRIAGADGKTRKTCNGPAPDTMTADEARIAVDGEGRRYDWWFTQSREQVTPDQQHPTAASKFVYINHDTSNCEASAGETYSADYLGRMPEQGCFGATAEEADDYCVAMLGGRSGDWTCFNGTDAEDYCTIPTGGAVVGTCICGQRYVAPPEAAPCTPGEANAAVDGNCPWGCAPGDAYCPARPKICPP